jgi:hypothetical protein
MRINESLCPRIISQSQPSHVVRVHFAGIDPVEELVKVGCHDCDDGWEETGRECAGDEEVAFYGLSLGTTGYACLGVCALDCVLDFSYEFFEWTE